MFAGVSGRERIRGTSRSTSARKLAAVLAVATALGAGCKRRDPKPAAPSASAGPNGAPADAARVTELTALEARRDAADISAADLQSRDVRVRRRAARALARIEGPRAAKLLAPALADEDPDVDAWAAYGLGVTCRGREPSTVRALVARAASLDAEPEPNASRARAPAPDAAITDALARCGTPDAERTLAAWLDGNAERAEDAALALGQLANRRHRLDDATEVALLDAANRAGKPVAAALFPFSRLAAVSGAVRTRLLAVATAALDAHGDRLSFAVRALSAAGPKAVPVLEGIVANDKTPAADRANAARELGTLDTPGQRALASALQAIWPAQLTEDHLVSDAWAPLWATLDALKPPARGATKTLNALAELALPGHASAPLERRIVELRCRAAALLAGSASLAPRLVHCDPAGPSRARALAVISVLDRGPLTGTRYARWKSFASSTDAVVREAALELMPRHSEIPHASDALVDALRSTGVGVVATAAQVIAEYPDRVASIERAVSSAPATAADAGAPAPPLQPALTAVKPKPGVVQALTRALDVKRPADATDVTSALIDAAGALELLSVKSKLEGYCASENATLRAHAERALRALGDARRECRTQKPLAHDPPELATPLPAMVELDLSTDVGSLKLELDAELAPVAVGRVVALARAGFYDGIVVHRAVPGFVVQFGDRGGDGFGGAGRAPLPSETSPLEFSALSTGLAIGGRDTGSSQLFVTLGAFPYLDGDYPLLGRAEGDWSALAVGDVIRKVSVAP
jgi:cyclophilin family peptidyl-prolyl cis-trans isomerase